MYTYEQRKSSVPHVSFFSSQKNKNSFSGILEVVAYVLLFVPTNFYQVENEFENGPVWWQLNGHNG